VGMRVITDQVVGDTGPNVAARKRRSGVR
jgi:hypothetical protein